MTALEDSGLLSSADDVRFDLIIRMAADLLDATMAVVCLEPAARPFPKAQSNLDPVQMAQCLELFTQAAGAEGGAISVIEDAGADPRFADHPLVTGALQMRFHSGALICDSNGRRLGALCVIDSQPRPRPSSRDLDRLRRLADMAAEQIELSGRLVNAGETEVLARLLADNTSDVITFVNMDGRLSYLSSGCLHMTGYEPDEIVGKMATKIIYKEDWAAVAEAFELTLKGEVGRRVEYRLRHKDGRIVWIEARPTLVRDPQSGVVLGVSDAMRDITARRRTEAELATSEGRYRTLFEALATGVVVQDRTGAIIEANAAASEVLGLTRDELLGRQSIDTRWKAERGDGTPFPGEEHPAMVTLKTGRTVRRELMRVSTPDGQIRLIEVSADPLFETAEELPSHVVCTFQDVTEIHQAQQELRERDRWFHRLLQAFPMAVYTTDTEGVVTFWNDAAAALWGKEPTAGETRWCGAFAVLTPEGQRVPPESSPMAIAIRTGQRVRGVDAQIERPDGSRVAIMPFPTPIYDSQGRISGAINVLVDISDQKLAEDRQDRLIRELELSRSQMLGALEAAELANRAKTAFLANMSHEIRTPLNGVLGVAGVLASAPLQPREQDMVGLIMDSAKTLEAILSDILDWSKVEAGKLVIEHTPFQPDKALAAVIDLMRIRAEEKGLDFNVRTSGPVDQPYDGDSLRIKQVVANFLSNAIKFTDQGHVEIEIAIDEPIEGETHQMLEISVRDTGVGFDGDTRDRLFDRFEQADVSFTRKYGGTGLGLPISLALTELMGGALQVSSTPGQGSTFTASIPLRRSAVTKPAELAPERPRSVSALRVLLAEDHPTNQKVVAMMLEPLGVSLTIVDDGAKAVEAFHAEPFDLVLMDMQMPVMDGLDAIRRIRATEAQSGRARTPVAVLSANAGEEHRALSASAGADAHISKPITPDTLLEGLERAFAAAEATADTGSLAQIS